MFKAMNIVIALCCFIILIAQNCWSEEVNELENQPLYLTPLLERGEISEALENSRVKPGIGNITSYSGYFSVNKECESNLFFWFFLAQNSWEKAPVVLWVEGGPGITSLKSLFKEIGPLTYDTKGGLGRRKNSWNAENNLLFIDQPVGTGFSFSGKNCFARNNVTVGAEFYSAVVQFFKLFPGLRKNNFFIAGQSYAGHFIPALAKTIHVNNPMTEVQINLSGMMIGNAFVDFYYQSSYGTHLYQLGLIDKNVRDVFLGLEDKLKKCLKNQEWEEVQSTFLTIQETYNEQVGDVSKYNYLKRKGSELINPYKSFVELPETRKAIHVGNTNFLFYNPEVGSHLWSDVVSSAMPVLEELLEHYVIVFYSGQLDILVSYTSIDSVLSSLSWSGKDEFNNATRRRWCMGDEQAGFVKGGHNLFDVLVRNAGHFAPEDQPLWLHTLVNSVTSAPRGNPLHALGTCL